MRVIKRLHESFSLFQRFSGDFKQFVYTNSPACPLVYANWQVSESSIRELAYEYSNDK